jgi:exonuclease III
MNGYNSLRILQYNINHGKDATLVPLLRDTSVQDFDVLAVQEPWRNPFMNTSYNPSTSTFHLSYPPKPLARVCFYVNKRIDPSSWSVITHNEDLQTLTIRYGPTEDIKTVKIHNIYNPSPQSYTALVPGTLATLQECLREDTNDHILLGDFNLHHPLWAGLSRPTQHASSDILLDIARNHSLELATPQGTVTWRSRGTHSTIDLTFVSETLASKIIKCQPRLDIAQSSDHLPIETTINIRPQTFVNPRRRCWKKLDVERLRETLDRSVIQNGPLDTNTQIDTRIHELTQTVTNAIEECVPWAHPSNHANEYWSEECAEAVHRTRDLFYKSLRENTPTAERRYQVARNEKIATIRRFKRKQFRKQIAEVTSSPLGTWKLAKWARTRGGTPKQPPQLPQLVATRSDPDGREIQIVADSLEDKFTMLQEQFFPQPLEADLSDIQGHEYPESVDHEQEIKETEIHEALRQVTNDKAPGPDQIPNRIIKSASAWLVPKLLPVFNATIRNGYHPVEWKKATTLALRKPNKADYSTPKAYRPIALLNSMGKILELVITRKLSKLAEENHLLPESQMGARRGRSTETALQMLTEQIHTVWDLPGQKRVATIMSMDISGAFDHVSWPRLLHNPRKRRIPLVYIRWIESFLNDRTTTIKLFEGESQPFATRTGIPQGSPVSPIIFLFFIADLLDTTNNEARQISAVGFVDDVNVLVYGPSTETNCRKLEGVHRECAQWAATHGVRFAPDKYEIIHFSRASKKFNMQAIPRIDGLRHEAKDHIRILGVEIDSKLSWGPHINRIQDKYASQSLALGRITASTWGACFKRARTVYSSVIRPVLTYGASIWYSPQGTATARKSMDAQLETLQNKSLRTILGAYKAVGGPILEKEADIPPISVILSKLVANAVKRRHTGKGHQLITKACEKIRRGNPRQKAQRTTKAHRPLPSKISADWLKKKIPIETWNHEILREVTTQPTVTWEQALKKVARESWDERWTKYLTSLPPERTPAQSATNRNLSKLHEGISKATSSLITQIRTEKIGLNAFLTDRRVPGFTAACDCGWRRQTAKHILMLCPIYADTRPRLFEHAGSQSYPEIVATARGARAAAIWMQQTGLLPQFSLGLEA